MKAITCKGCLAWGKINVDFFWGSGSEQPKQFILYLGF